MQTMLPRDGRSTIASRLIPVTGGSEDHFSPSIKGILILGVGHRFL